MTPDNGEGLTQYARWGSRCYTHRHYTHGCKDCMAGDWQPVTN